MTNPEWAKTQICHRCKKRPGDVIESEGVSAWVHGSFAAVCNICITEAQLVHAKERAAAIPKLEEQLAELKAMELIK